METINSKDIALLYGYDTTIKVFEEFSNEELQFFIFKNGIHKDKSGTFYNNYVYAVSPDRQVRCYDMFKQWRYSFEQSPIKMERFVELIIEKNYGNR